MNLELFSFGTPGDVLRRQIEDKGWTQDDLAFITGKSRRAINDLICGRVSITPEMAVSLAAAFGNQPSDWMGLEAQYRIARVRTDDGEMRRKAQLMQFAPVRDMQRRGWINQIDKLDDLERELKAFFGVESLAEPPRFPVATKRQSSLPYLSPAEWAWCFRARRLAGAVLHLAVFDSRALDATEKRLRELAAHPKEARHVEQVFSEAGIRFVVVEPLPGTKVDGAVFWLDERSPVIAVSGRVDRIDNIWFTIMHEFAHVRNNDALSVDSDILGDDAPVLVEDESERRANDQAAAALIPRSEIESFIRRVGPLYSKTRIVQFAHRIKIHPGIIVGQLQHRKEIGYSANREMLVKIRETVVETALTDGWGRTITPGIL